MNDPTRLLASADSTDLERELLSSWDERPSQGARTKTLAMLGVAGAATTVAGAATAGASIAPKAAAAGWLALAKWTAVTVIAVGAVAAGIGVATKAHEDATPAATTTAQSPVTPVATATATTETKTIELPSDTDTTRRAPQTAHHDVTAQPAASTLTEQVAALDRARAALDARDGAKALQLALAYESEYPGGAFTQEAEVVRIEALSRDGNRAEAERAGKHFLASYPKSPHAARVRALLGYDP